jgi:hypothetical protein
MNKQLLISELNHIKKYSELLNNIDKLKSNEEKIMFNKILSKKINKKIDKLNNLNDQVSYNQEGGAKKLYTFRFKWPDDKSFMFTLYAEENTIKTRGVQMASESAKSAAIVQSREKPIDVDIKDVNYNENIKQFPSSLQPSDEAKLIRDIMELRGDKQVALKEKQVALKEIQLLKKDIGKIYNATDMIANLQKLCEMLYVRHIDYKQIKNMVDKITGICKHLIDANILSKDETQKLMTILPVIKLSEDEDKIESEIKKLYDDYGKNKIPSEQKSSEKKVQKSKQYLQSLLLPPSQPSQPPQPSQPSHPSQPSQPSQPPQPSQPSHPSQPSQPPPQSP